jgi:rhodanese-related sulfurtransferase
VQEAYDQIKKNGSAVFIDVRESDEWAAGHPSGAILIPLSEFDQAAPAKLSDKNAEIYVICRSGNRSRIASQQLIDMGYTGVFNVDGGYEAWLAASLPTALD